MSGTVVLKYFNFRDDFDEQYEHATKKSYTGAAALDSVYNFKGVPTSEPWADEELLLTDNDRKLLQHFYYVSDAIPPALHVLTHLIITICICRHFY